MGDPWPRENAHVQIRLTFPSKLWLEDMSNLLTQDVPKPQSEGRYRSVLGTTIDEAKLQHCTG